MEKYSDRQSAGQVLAEKLHHYANNPQVIVLALPRGGVPVAYAIASQLNVPLDVFLVRKLGVPFHPELAMGAIARDASPVLNEDIIKELGIKPEAIERVLQEEKKELIRRDLAYRGQRPFPNLRDKIILLVDDGIATGATMRAAIKALRTLHPAEIVVAIPVGDRMICNQLSKLADHVVCPLMPSPFYAVGAWYDYFPQTEDEEVKLLLKAARSISSSH